MPQTVVDQLEAIQINEKLTGEQVVVIMDLLPAFLIQNRILIQNIERGFELIYEIDAVGEPGQRVGNLSLGDVGLRAGDADGASVAISDGDSPAQYPDEAAVLVTHAVFAGEFGGCARQVSGDLSLDAAAIRRE